MDQNASGSVPPPPPEIFILSGGVGASGEQVVYTVLAQFPNSVVHTQTIGSIRQPEQIAQVLEQAKATGGLVVCTLVDRRLRDLLISESRAMQVPVVDLMGPLLGWLTDTLGQDPLQQPGRYRQLHREYFDRVSAIDFTLHHDDGKNREGWPQAEVVLVGVSRSGKTPLSVYLAVLGWKVANYPLVPQLPIPDELFALDPRKLVGVTIDPEQLLMFRRQRQYRLGVQETSIYTDLEAIREELQAAQKLFRRGGWTVINMTDKTIEQGADEIIRKLTGSTTASAA